MSNGLMLHWLPTSGAMIQSKDHLVFINFTPPDTNSVLVNEVGKQIVEAELARKKIYFIATHPDEAHYSNAIERWHKASITFIYCWNKPNPMEGSVVLLNHDNLSLDRDNFRVLRNKSNVTISLETPDFKLLFTAPTNATDPMKLSRESFRSLSNQRKIDVAIIAPLSTNNIPSTSLNKFVKLNAGNMVIINQQVEAKLQQQVFTISSDKPSLQVELFN